MKVIDDKGRLFGKINVIDFIALFFLLCLVPMLYFGNKIFNKNIVPVKGEPSKNFEEMDIDCVFIKLEAGIAQSISIGDKQVNDVGDVIAEVVGLDAVEPYVYEFDLGEGHTIIKESSDLKQRKAKIKLKALVEDKALYFNAKAVKLQSPLEFITSGYRATVLPVKVKRREEVEILVQAEFRNLLPELAAVIKEGDEQIKIAEEMHGSRQRVGRITKIISDNPSEVLSLSDDGRNWAISGHPRYRDVVLELELLCEKKDDNQLFFVNNPVKIGSPFYFVTNLYSLSGQVLRINQK